MHGCISFGLEGAERVCLSSVLPNRQVSGKGQKGRGDHSSGGTGVAITAMVCQPTEHAGGGANLIASSSKLVRAGRAYLGGLEGLSRRYRQSGFSQTATSLLTSACHDGTGKAYEEPWKWSSCCDQKQMIHFRPL